ncbi:O-antigen ligase family protein [Arthrobacter alpinus]|uniref:O-antigen ligase family protein n=1 Tax=Arthrobacter alpinus TaxID=656366 RepID=UPI00101AE73B|nr:O-antigen ligase family protein [Arthrobacter alpinus]
MKTTALQTDSHGPVGQAYKHQLLRDLAPYVTWLLVVASVVSWRKGVYYSGGADPVVLAKAALGILALATAVIAYRFTQNKQSLSARSVGFLLAYVAISTIGAVATGSLGASTVLSIRVLLVAVTIVFLLGAFPARPILVSLLTVMALTGVLAAVTGFQSILAGDRIFGVVPPLNPNDISLLCCLPALGLVHELSYGKTKFIVGAPALLVLFSLVWLTGSRTGLFATMLAMILIVLHRRRWRLGVVLSIFALIPVVFYILVGTNTLAKVIERGDPTGANLLTLNARTIAWTAVLNTPPGTWARWVGSGLIVKQVAVAGQYWQDQVLDSSWISALAQAGVIGTVILAIWCLATVVSSFRSGSIRSFTTPALVLVLVRSFLENGLVDSSIPFIFFFVVALLVERHTSNATKFADRVSNQRLVQGSAKIGSPDGLAQQSGHR